MFDFGKISEAMEVLKRFEKMFDTAASMIAHISNRQQEQIEEQRRAQEAVDKKISRILRSLGIADENENGVPDFLESRFRSDKSE